ncbi:MAG: monovalent cation/H+ antiporter complex subunit F [Acidimicrobiia bacterium]|nr:monovalent cation/H+ antiporter complex subunit F [Acidimicrobiia bacterium]
MINVALVMLSLAACAFMYRLLRGPTLPDRVIALDGLLATIVIGAILAAASSAAPLLLSTVLVVAVAGFVGTSALARFIERRGG